MLQLQNTTKDCTCMLQNSQTLTPIFLLNHNHSLVHPHITILISQNYCKESNLSYSVIYMKVFIISLLNTYPLWTNLITRANCHYYLLDSQKYLSEAMRV